MSPGLKANIANARGDRRKAESNIAEHDLLNIEFKIPGYTELNADIDLVLRNGIKNLNDINDTKNLKDKDIWHTKRNEDVSDKMERAVMDHQYLSQYQSVKKIRTLEKAIKKLQKVLTSIKDFQKKNNGVVLPTINEKRAEIESRISSAMIAIMEVKESGPEGSYMHGLLQLRDWHRQLHQGKMVETKSIRDKALRVEDAMRAGKPILIHGPPGTGKTELARHVAEKIARTLAESNTYKEQVEKDVRSESYRLISGSKETQLSELTGHKEIVSAHDIEGKVQREVAIELIKFVTTSVDEYVVNYTESHGMSPSDTEVGSMRQLYTEAFKLKIMATLESGIRTKFILGPMYECMEKGMPLIIDEGNAIPTELIIAVNDNLTKKPGDPVRTQQNGGREFKIKEGFCFVITGNIGENYQGRKRFESSLINRIGLDLAYDYMPNAHGVDDKVEDMASQSENWQVMLAYFMDKGGRMRLPEGDIHDMWQMSKAIRYAQDVFEGYISIDNMMTPSGSIYPADYAGQALQNKPITMRDIFRILSNYKEDPSHDMGYYIMRDFVMTESASGDARAVYIKIFTDFGFFGADSGIKVDKKKNGEQILVGDETEITDMMRKRTDSIITPIKVYSSRETVALAFGAESVMGDIEEGLIANRYEALIGPEDKKRLDLESKRAEAIAAVAQLKIEMEEMAAKNQEAVDKALNTVINNQGKLKQILVSVTDDNKKKLLAKSLSGIDIKIDDTKTQTIKILEDILTEQDKLMKEYGVMVSRSPNVIHRDLTRLTPVVENQVLNINTNPSRGLEIRNIRQNVAPGADLCGMHQGNNFKNWVGPHIKNKKETGTLDYSIYAIGKNANGANMTTLDIFKAAGYMDQSGNMTSIPAMSIEEAINTVSQMISDQSLLATDTNVPIKTDPLDTASIIYNMFLVYDYKDAAAKAANQKTAFAVYAHWSPLHNRWVLGAGTDSLWVVTGNHVFLRN